MANCALALQPWESPKHLTEAGSQPPASKLLVNSFASPAKKRGPVPPDGVVFAAWPVRLLPRSVRLIK
jgi:hypothetical protein